MRAQRPRCLTPSCVSSALALRPGERVPTLLFATAAAAEEPAAFGRQKQIAISSDFQLQLSHTTTTITSFDRQAGVTHRDATLTLRIAPAADYFVLDGLSVGGQLILNYVKSGDTHATEYGVAPRIGYDLGLTNVLSVWPRVGLSWLHDPANLSDPALNRLSFVASVPLLVHPSAHFFAGIGPAIATDLVNKTERRFRRERKPRQTHDSRHRIGRGWLVFIISAEIARGLRHQDTENEYRASSCRATPLRVSTFVAKARASGAAIWNPVIG